MKEGINNTADTKEGMDGQTFEEDWNGLQLWVLKPC